MLLHKQATRKEINKGGKRQCISLIIINHVSWSQENQQQDQNATRRAGHKANVQAGKEGSIQRQSSVMR